MQRWLLAMPFAIFITSIHHTPSHASPKVFIVQMPTTNMAGIVINKIWYWFDNSRNMDGCIMVGRGCYKSSGLKVKYNKRESYKNQRHKSTIWLRRSSIWVWRMHGKRMGKIWLSTLNEPSSSSSNQHMRAIKRLTLAAISTYFMNTALKLLALSSFVLVAPLSTHSAEQMCKVRDPNDTYVNLRYPANGEVMRSQPNGSWICLIPTELSTTTMDDLGQQPSSKDHAPQLTVNTLLANSSTTAGQVHHSRNGSFN